MSAPRRVWVTERLLRTGRWVAVFSDENKREAQKTRAMYGRDDHRVVAYVPEKPKRKKRKAVKP